MNDDHMHEVLDRATDAVEPVGLGAHAMTTARRRRARRRGAAAGAASVTAVVLAVVVHGVTGTTASPPSPTPATSGPTTPTPSVTPSPEPAVAPSIPESRIQPEWDPRDVESLPVLDLGVPRVLPLADSGAVTTAVALLDHDDVVLLVGSDGAQAPLALPGDLGRYRSVVALSPDGRRVALTGVRGLYWRDLDGGDWRLVDVPRSVLDRVSPAWLADSASLILRDYGPGVRVDLASGATERLPQLSDYASWAADADGRLTYLSHDPVPLVASEQADGSVTEIDRGPLKAILGFVVSDDSLAAVRAYGGYAGGVRAVDDVDGMIALDRTTLATRAFLPVPDASSWYTDGGALAPLAWLDDDTVLLTVRPVDNPKLYLVAWDVETGDLSRVACWPREYLTTFATDLLGAR